jgi:hypothetical protein
MTTKWASVLSVTLNSYGHYHNIPPYIIGSPCAVLEVLSVRTYIYVYNYHQII